jgi:hypothetical protein
MRFLLLHLGNEMALAQLPPAELDRIVAEKTKVTQELAGLGKAIVGHRLWPTAAATRVSRSAGRYVTVDGPFAETKDVIGGFDLIQCASREEAVEWAKRFLVHDAGLMEVRTVWERCLCHGSYSCSARI